MPYEKAGATSRAINSSSRMMCSCGIPGKNVRQIRWVIPYSSTKRRILRTHSSGPPMMKRSSISRSRSVAIEASMKGWRQPPAYSLRYAIMMCASASSRAFRSVLAMIRSRVRGHSVIGWLRPAARRLSRKRFLPSRSRLRSAVGPGIQLSASVAARLSVMSPPAADPHRWMGFRHGFGLEASVDGVVRALEADPLLGPETLDDRKLLLEPRPPLFQLDTVEGELVGLVADRDPEGETPAGHDVEHCRVLCQPYGLVESGDEDVGAERQPRRSRCEAGEHHQRRGPVMVRHRVVLFHPDRVEAELLGLRDLFERFRVVVTPLDGNEADLEARHEARA